MRKRIIITAVVVALVGAGALAIAGTMRYAGSQEDALAVKVNGEKISTEEVERAISNRALLIELSGTASVPVESGAPGAATDRNAVVNDMIESTLFDEEAKRRGIACSDVEVQQTARENLVVNMEYAAVTLVANGFAPREYVDVPAAERTPDTRSLIETFVSDKDVLATLHKVCRRTKLYEQLAAATGAPQDLQRRNEAILALKDELYRTASIERAPGY